MENKETKIVKTGDWFVTLLITTIPLVGFILLFVWAFGGTTNLSKANWAKAILIWIATVVFLVGLLFLIFGSAMLSNINI